MSETENAPDSTASIPKGTDPSTGGHTSRDGDKIETTAREVLRQQLKHTNEVKKVAHHTSVWACEYETIAAVDDDNLYAYSDGIWGDRGEQVLRKMLWEFLGEDFTPNMLTHVKHQLKSARVIDRDEFRTPEGTVAVKNGLIDLDKPREKCLESPSPEHRATWRLPVRYDPHATCPEFKWVLREWIPDDHERMKIQEFVGYALDDTTAKHEKMLLLLGPTDTGKTKFLEVVEALFGAKNTAHQSIQFLANERWGIDKVVGNPVNIRHDLDTRAITRPGVVKELASGNPMKAEKKGGDPYEARPTAKHFFSANRVPEIKTPDSAFFNRWLTVLFTEQIPRDDQDPDLANKLTTSAELSGVLNWAIEGYQRLEKQGHFTGARLPEKTRALWQKNGGSIDRFIHKHIEVDPGAKIPKELVYASYKEFADAHGVAAESQHMLTKKLKAIDSVDDGQRRFDGERKTAYIGVKLTG